MSVEKDKYISVRRTQFPVSPADTRVVYGAQGETMAAVQVALAMMATCVSLAMVAMHGGRFDWMAAEDLIRLSANCTVAI